MTLMNKGVIIVASALTLSALTGCTALSHVSAKLSHGSVSFAYCEELTPTMVEVQIAKSGAERLKYSTAWIASGSSPIALGHPVRYGTPPPGFVTSKGPVTFSAATSHIDVLFEDTDGSNPGSSLQAVFDGSKLVDGKWLNWNGQIVNKACDG